MKRKGHFLQKTRKSDDESNKHRKEKCGEPERRRRVVGAWVVVEQYGVERERKSKLGEVKLKIK